MATFVKTSLRVLDPTAGPVARGLTLAARPGTLDGKVVGLLDSSKVLARALLDGIVLELKKDHKIAGVVVRRKPTAWRIATKEMLDELAAESDVVINAIGD
ncbi:MAG: hypothetical protein HYY45_06225 [Deltaproteobacteria bacterium]|nr:hypothetical protein [Deltaproteobacteria bacterium]